MGVRSGGNDDSILNSWKTEAAAEIGKRIAVAIAAGSGGEGQCEEGEEEAKEWELDVGNVLERIVKVVVLIGGSNVGHAEAVDKTAKYRNEEIGQGESGREGDERLLRFSC